MLTLKDIDRRIRGAFLPFRCAVEVGSWDAKMHVQVFDHSRNRILEISRLPVDRARDEGYLNGLLSQLRHRVQESGYTLKPVS
jgi:hypothetical protein